MAWSPLVMGQSIPAPSLLPPPTTRSLRVYILGISHVPLDDDPSIGSELMVGRVNLVNFPVDCSRIYFGRSFLFLGQARGNQGKRKDLVQSRDNESFLVHSASPLKNLSGILFEQLNIEI